MNGIIININPVIGYIGPLEIRWYSLAIMVAIVSAVIISLWQAKKKGMSTDIIISLVPWVLLGGILGARMFHIFDHWSYYMANPGLILNLQQGGLAIWGALLGGVLAAVICTLVKRIPLRKLLDIAVPGLLVAQIIGRLGCIINGDAYGGPTTLPWGFIYIHPQAMLPPGLMGIPTHPYPVYDMLWNGLVLILIMIFRPRFKQDGIAFATYLGMYAVGRFILSFVRQERILFWGLQEAQVVAIFILIGVGVAWLLLLKRQSKGSCKSA
jgi:phosphatidylglycerol:prolipoprotein diacylglycerol transferase